jgi:hypothetical protein
MKEPIGRSGLQPLRDWRTALATASMASSWPMTRSAGDLPFGQVFAPPSSSRETGMPVRSDNLGDVVIGDLRRILADFWNFASAAFSFVSNSYRPY